MIEAISGEAAKHARKLNKSKVHWRVNYLGRRVDQIMDAPQAELVEMSPHEVIRPHFHQVDQFQVMVDGHGSIGRNEAKLVAVHYADRHTAYGPITAGPFGLSFFSIRSKSDPGAIWLHKPDHKAMMRPSKKRYLFVDGIELSTEPVLKGRSKIAMDTVVEPAEHGDGLGALVLRMGVDATIQGPAPNLGGGQVYLVLNGSLLFDKAVYAPWSMIYFGPTEPSLEVRAGSEGLEALVLNFPYPDA